MPQLRPRLALPLGLALTLVACQGSPGLLTRLAQAGRGGEGPTSPDGSTPPGAASQAQAKALPSPPPTPGKPSLGGGEGPSPAPGNPSGQVAAEEPTATQGELPRAQLEAWWLERVAWQLQVTPGDPVATIDMTAQQGPEKKVPFYGSREGRLLRMRLYLPASARRVANKLPVIVFSHGFNPSPQEGDKVAEPAEESYAYLGRHLASQGYVVVHPNHRDDFTLLPKALPKAVTELQQNAFRPTDVRFALDVLRYCNESPVGILGMAAKFDLERVGMAGHSYGAYTAMAVDGMLLDFPEHQLTDQSFGIDAVKAVLALSPQGEDLPDLPSVQGEATSKHYGVNAGAFRGIQKPTYLMAGADEVDWAKPDSKADPARLQPTDPCGMAGAGVLDWNFVGRRVPNWRLSSWDQLPKQRRYKSLIAKTCHSDFGQHASQQHEAMTPVQRFVAENATLFFDHHVKGSIPASRLSQLGKLALPEGRPVTTDQDPS